MHVLDLTKPDGRPLTLYGRSELRSIDDAPSPFSTPVAATAHLRWHPLRGEWVTYAAARQERTFQPPPEYDPLAPTRDAQAPTEVPAGNWDVAVFGNRFPALSLGAREAPPAVVESRPAVGACEVIVYTQAANGSLGTLPLDHLELLIQVWADRTRRLAADPSIRYVLPFENRGTAVGATLAHPHGQLYAYPVVPPVPLRMHDVARAHHAEHGVGPLQALVAREREAGTRVLYDGDAAVAFVPACARYPYEVWIAPHAAVPDFASLSGAQRADLARALKTVVLKYDGLWDRPMPYVMAWYQAPLDGDPHPEAHLHAALCPPYRSRERLKYLAGTELAAGFFTMDVLPESTAAELQAVSVDLASPA